MSKKIDSALSELIKALRKHARVAGSRPISSKRAQRATARVAAAAGAYAGAVIAKSGMSNPFSDAGALELEEATVASLEAERDDLADKRDSKVTEARKSS